MNFKLLSGHDKAWWDNLIGSLYETLPTEFAPGTRAELDQIVPELRELFPGLAFDATTGYDLLGFLIMSGQMRVTNPAVFNAIAVALAELKEES